MNRFAKFSALTLVLSSAVFAQSLPAQRLTEAFLDASFSFRNLGPFRTGAWITDFAVPSTPAREHRYTFYVGTRNGGIWKTENGGTTFEPVFDKTGALSIGAVAVAPSDANVVWAGTGESYVARYSYWGDGVYKSTDGGRTWQNMGLRETQHIARIVIHPRNPDIVLVAAMGRLHGPNPERGVFRTEDGGRTWHKVLYIDERIGVIDLVLAEERPDLLYAATYEKVRYPWHLEIAGPGSAVHRSTDGGRTWTRLRGGLPEGRVGRIGIDVYRRNPDIVYAVVENANPREGRPGAERVAGGRGEVYRSDDGGNTWRMTHSPEINVGGKAPYSFNILRVDPNDDRRVYVTSDALLISNDAGRTWSGITGGARGAGPAPQGPPPLFRRMFGDVRTLWIDPEDSQRIMVGSDGGVNITYDGGRTVDFLPNLAIGEIYALAADMEDPYNIYVGLQDHESWRGPINGFAGQVGIENWITVGTGDGMYNAVDPVDSRWAYNTLQFGGHVRVDQQSATLTQIQPRRPRGQTPLRYTWTTPIVLSPHDPSVLYTGAQVVLRSRDRGDTWEEISPDLTTNDSSRINGFGNIQFCTITTLAESPRERGVIWVGTDDGRVQLTRDDGRTWTNLTARLIAAGAPDGYWVTRVVPSRHAAGTAFVTLTGFHRDVFRPFVFRTDDHGASWRSLVANLPAIAPANVIAEDVLTPSLLFLGTDRGLFVSTSSGDAWLRMQANMPILPVRDLLVHPREADLIVGTHGRGAFVTDITPLRELNEALLARGAHLFAIEPKGWRVESGWGNYRLFGHRHINTPNEPNGFVIRFYQSNTGPATLKVRDAEGKELRVFEQESGSGMRQVVWDLRDSENQRVQPGNYTVTLEVAGQSLTQPAVVKPPVVVPRGFAAGSGAESR